MLENAINQSIAIKKKILFFDNKIKKIIDKIYNTLKSGNKIYICGNGGSAADAQHLAAEFLVRLRPKINRKPFPVISLLQDTSTITACANDYGFENIFSRNLSALASKGDILFALSTSGNSKNIINVLKLANNMGIFTISFLGAKGGKAKDLASIELIIPSNNTARIQETHMFLGHYIFEIVENKLIKL
jgi:D-sedoheptulose 7-phosphate isomerase